MRQLFLFTIFIWSAATALSQVTIQMKREGGVSIVPCKVNGLKLNFIFDTGASEVSISMTEATFMLKNDYLSKDDIVGQTNYMDANGNINAGVKIILREIEIGGLKLTNVKASVVNNMKAPLLLGQSAINKLGVVQLNLSANTLIIFNKEEQVTAEDDKEDNIVDSLVKTEDEPDRYEALYNEAKDNFDKGNYEKTISSIDLLVAEKPMQPKALLLRAISNDILGDYKSAIADYTRMIAIDAKDATAYCYRGKSKHDSKDYTGALADFNKALLLNDSDAEGYAWRAQTKSKLNNLSGAMQDFNKAISLEPQTASHLVNRALLKSQIDDNAGAVIDCNKALNIDDENAFAYFCRGNAKRKLRQYSGALADFDRAIEYDSEYSAAYAARGSLKEDAYEDLDGAMADYDRALESDPKNVYASISKSLLEDKIKRNVWIPAGSSAKGDKWYIYNSAISKEYSTLKIWIKNEFKSTVVNKNGRSITILNGHSLWLCLFNCAAQESKVLSIKNYDSKGNLITEYNNDSYEDFETVAPGTVMEMLLSKACEKHDK